MKPSYGFGRPSKEMQEEFRLLEEMMNNQNKYNSLRYKQILMDLKSGDEIKILEAVTQLSNELSMAQEDSLGGVQLDFLIPELIKCLDKEGIPDIMLYAGICITQILDIIPQCANILVNCGGVDILCQKMQNFEYIDVAENAIRALEKISEDYGGAILGTGGLDLMINMIDFFVDSIQKSILNIVSNTFRMVPNEQTLADQIIPAIPTLMNYLCHDPSKQESLVTMFSRLTDRIVRICADDFEKKKKYLETVAGDKLTGNLCLILSENIETFNSTKLAQTENIIRTLNRICYYSSKLCLEAFNIGLLNTIDKIFILLDSFSRKDGQFSILAHEMISLINSILALRASPMPLVGKIASFIGIKILENSRVNERLDMLKNNKQIMAGLVEKAATKLPSVYDSNQTSLHKYIVLICLEKLLSYAEEEDLKRALDPSSLSLFLSKLTESNDLMIVALTLQIVEIVFQKLPHTFNYLAREGLFEFISKLTDVEAVKKLEAVFVANKKLPGTTFSQAFPPVFSSKPNFPPQMTQNIANLGDTDQKYDNFLNYVQNLNQKFGGTTMQLAQPPTSTTNKFTVDSSGPFPGFKSDRDKFASYISEAKKVFEIKQLGEDSEINEENPDVQLKALEAKILKNESLLLKNESLELKKEFPTKVEKTFTMPTTLKNPGDPEAEPKNSEKEKLLQIYSEICEYAKGVQKKIEVVAEKLKTNLTEPQDVLKLLTGISEYLLKNQSNQSEFGISAFKNYVELIKEHTKVTIYELRRSKFIQNLLNFIFENSIEKKSTQATKASSPQRLLGEEEKLNTFPTQKDSPPKFMETRSKPSIEISDEQSRIILGRIIAFLDAFKTQSPRDPSSNILGNLVNNLQEMLINTDKLNTDQTGTQTNTDLNLLTDLKALSMRAKFKVHWLQEDFSLASLDKTKTFSSPGDSQTNNPFKDLQSELYCFKEDILREIPSLVLSVEQFGTLEVIEDYILNKLNSKEDILAFGGKMPNRKPPKLRPEDSFLDYIKEKMDSEAIDNELEGEEDADHMNEIIEDSKPEPTSVFIKTSNLGALNLDPGAGLNPNSMTRVSKSKALSSGLSLQKSSSIKQSRTDGKSRGDKKKWLDKLTGKEMNFKKYLEIRFFINGVEVNKTKALFELFYKYRPNYNYAQIPNDDAFTVDYRLCKRNQEYSSYGILLKEQQRSINSLCTDYKQVIQNLINKLKDLELGVNDDNLTSVVQFLLFLNELRYIDAQITSKSSLFAPALVDLSNKHGMQKCIEHYFESSLKSGLLPGELMLANKDLENLKLSSLLDKTVNDPIVLSAGLIPSPLRGIALQSNFLLDLNSRMKFYKLGCSHITRALFYIYQANRLKLKELESSRVGKLRKKKIKATREKILENAVVNMESYGFKKSLLEFEFQDEEGTGLGPTLEYYAIVAEEFKNPVHNLWRKTDINMLFPSPIDPFDLRYPDPSKPKRRQPAPDKRRDFEKFQLLFRCLGTLTARAILDERVVDIPFHPLFWDLPVYLEDIAKIDKQLGDSLIALQAIVNKKHEIEKDPNLSSQEKSSRILELKFKGCSIDDLALNFTLPGYEEIDLIENGEDMPVTLSNLDQYVSIMTQYYLVETNKSQILAFRDGFDKVFPLKYLQALRSDEIEYLVCGVRVNEDWDQLTLQENILPSHGFSKNSSTYQNFIKLLLEFNDEQKKLFFKFTTGSERLPLGGLKLLNPKMTVVKKSPSDPSRSPDEYLPSVMTCQNYIKLPDYSSISVMRERIHTALKEGQASFSLS